MNHSQTESEDPNWLNRNFVLYFIMGTRNEMESLKPESEKLKILDLSHKYLQNGMIFNNFSFSVQYLDFE